MSLKVFNRDLMEDSSHAYVANVLLFFEEVNVLLLPFTLIKKLS